jgi:urease accessory protein
MSIRLALAAVAALAAGPAFAHTGVGATHGFGAGFAHPFGGLDHLLAMTTVGLLAASLGGRAVWAVPASFVAMMLAGAALGIAGLQLPAVELAIALSVVVLGAAVALGKPGPLGAVMALVGGFAVFHGFAHGSEMPASADAATYVAGFTLATLMQHGAGLGIGMVAASHPALVRGAGVSVAAAGLLFLFQLG